METRIPGSIIFHISFFARVCVCACAYVLCVCECMYKLKHGPKCHMEDIGAVMIEARGPKARGLLS